MNIGIVGTGPVGSELASGLAAGGRLVMLGSRDASQPRLKQWAEQDPQHRRFGDERRAVEFGDIVFIAIPGRALPEMLQLAGRDAFEGKLVVDVSNPFAKGEHGESVDAYGDEFSGAEYLQREVPTARVVKALNEINWNVMFHPERTASGTVRIAGDDEGAKRQVRELLEGFGWQVRDLGGLEHARELEHAVIERYR